jgi:hypothetical protein
MVVQLGYFNRREIMSSFYNRRRNEHLLRIKNPHHGIADPVGRVDRALKRIMTKAEFEAYYRDYRTSSKDWRRVYSMDGFKDSQRSDALNVAICRDFMVISFRARPQPYFDFMQILGKHGWRTRLKYDLDHSRRIHPRKGVAS